jgi:hypothetical protein
MTEEKKVESSIGRTFQYAFESYKAEDWEKVFNAVSDLMIKSKQQVSLRAHYRS